MCVRHQTTRPPCDTLEDMRADDHHQRYGREAGNAVTLTLLGLALAILAGVVVLYYVGQQTPQPTGPLTPQVEDTTATSTAVDPRAGWRSYTDDTYQFSIQFPPGWIVATGTILSAPVVTVYDPQSLATSTTNPEEARARVSVYPHGIPTDSLPAEEEHQSTVIITVPMATAKDYQLGSKRPWATIARFDRSPASWDAGFVFARAPVEEEEVTYMRGDAPISQDQYDPMAGDRIVRNGFVDPAVRALEEEILRSFAFVTDSSGAEATSSISDLIRVEQPAAGDKVVSPLTIRGTARGSWFFEASFPVRLETDTGDVLAEVPARALGDWMTEDMVPFEVSLAFGTTTATSGKLILKNDNPSGQPERDRSLEIPIVFGEGTN
jgi:hypothetical protein